MGNKNKSWERSRFNNKIMLMKTTTQINYLILTAMITMMIKMTMNNLWMNMEMNKIQTKY